MAKTVTITINESGDAASLDNIPASIWEQFKKNAKEDFPKAGDDAWAHYLSEVIMGVGGGTPEVKTIFMTDVPVENATALNDLFKQVDSSWDRFHAYMLRASVMPGRPIRVINFHGGKQEWGTFIATGLRPESFEKVEKATGIELEDILAALFDGAAQGEVTFKGVIPPHAEKPV